MSLRLRPRKTAHFLQIHKRGFDVTGPAVGDQRDPTALKAAGHLQCGLSQQGMSRWALAFCRVCEVLHGDQSIQGPAKGPGALLGDTTDIKAKPQEHL